MADEIKTLDIPPDDAPILVKGIMFDEDTGGNIAVEIVVFGPTLALSFETGRKKFTYNFMATNGKLSAISGAVNQDGIFDNNTINSAIIWDK